MTTVTMDETRESSVLNLQQPSLLDLDEQPVEASGNVLPSSLKKGGKPNTRPSSPKTSTANKKKKKSSVGSGKKKKGPTTRFSVEYY